MWFSQTIFNKYLWKSVDRDGRYGSQCVDWVKKYCDEAGRPITTTGNAIDYWTNWLGKWWIRIPNTPIGIPQEWDIVIFSWPTKYWHIAVACARSSIKELNVIEQNWWKGTGTGKWVDAVRLYTYDYTKSKVLGWFRWIG